MLPFVAEFWNAISALLYVVVGGVGLCISARRGSNWRICVSWAALVLVGIGSVLFHATMRFSMELVDEVSMLLLVFSFMVGKEDCVWGLRDAARRLRFRLVVLALLTGAVLLYVTLFAYEIFVCAFFVVVVAEICLDIACWPQTWQPRVCFAIAVTTIGAGYTVWQLEQRMCFTEPRVWPLHVVWHVLSCVGGTFAILHNVFLRREKC